MTTKNYARTAVTAVAGVSMVMGMAGAATVAVQPAEAAASETPVKSIIDQSQDPIAQAGLVTDSVVQGIFSYDQSTITPNSTIKFFFNKVAQSLCGASAPLAASNPLEWKIRVSGDVENAFTATIDELAQDESTNQLMTCTCGGNPAGGRAIINADVTGIPVDSLLSKAGVVPGANTITFVSSDGKQESMPLAYVVGHHGVISYEINNEDLSASVGGNNQLWMMKTPANYFVRDIVEVRITAEDMVPAAPGTADEHPNSPNAGVLAGMQA